MVAIVTKLQRQHMISAAEVGTLRALETQLRLEEHRFIDRVLDQRARDLLCEVENLLLFVSLNFFVFRVDDMLVLHPEKNVDQASSPPTPDEEREYDELSERLDGLAQEMSERYRALRREVRERLTM
jgi:hypothetical protein